QVSGRSAWQHHRHQAALRDHHLHPDSSDAQQHRRKLGHRRVPREAAIDAQRARRRRRRRRRTCIKRAAAPEITQSMRDAAEILDLRPNPAILIGAGAALALVSAAFLPWPFAIASTMLGALMIAGADVDARTFLLPDTVTIGATVAGIVAAPLLDP